MHIASALILCLLSTVFAQTDTPASSASVSLAGRIRASVARLNELYWSPTLNIWLDRPGDDLRAHYEGRRNPPWWPSANAVEALIDFMDAAGASDYDATVGSLYELQKDHRTRRERLVAELKRRNQWSEADEQKWQRQLQRPAASPKAGYYTDFQNEYLDDSGWWGVTWLKMYRRTGEGKYLNTARTVHAHMAKNWKPEKGGGVVWCEDEDKQRPNAITNGLFLLLSGRLYSETGERAYLEWGEKTLAWFRANALYDGSAVVDAAGHQGDYWSYNQGVFIGGLVALYQASGRPEHLEEAAKVADGVLHRSGLMLPSGVLVEKLGTDGDACLFKGVLIRYLAQLRATLRGEKLHPELVREIERCIRNSAASLMAHSLEPDGLYSAEWHEGAKDRRTNFNTQVSAIAALVALEGVPAATVPEAAAAKQSGR